MFTFSIFFVGCRGDQQAKIIGKWKEIPFTEPTNTEKHWLFYSGDALTIYTVEDSVEVDSTFYLYDIEANTFEVVGEGPYLNAAADPRGEYEVDELTDKYFKITKKKHPDGTTNGAYLRIEMVKL